MSYVALEVDIDQGRIIPREPDKVPPNGSGLLTILQPAPKTGAPRPFGLAEGEFVVPPDFNAPLPDEVLRDFEGA